MLKSSKLVLGLGCLLGASVAFLPTRSFAAVIMTEDVNTVQINVDRVLSFEPVEGNAGHTVASASPTNPVAHPGASYNSSTNTYSATLLPGEDYSTDDLMTTKYRVICNYATGTQSSPTDNCANGWKVTASVTDPYKENGTAAMKATGVGNPSIISNQANAIDGSAANWLFKFSSDDVATYNGTNYSTPVLKTKTSTTSTSTPGQTATGDFITVPASHTAANATVVTGASIVTQSGINYYLGPRYFSVTYGFSAAANTIADTYTSVVEYILSIDN